MSRVQSRPASPAPTTHSTEHPPHKPGISPRPYSFIRPFPALPEQWQSPQAQARLLNEYLTHDGHFATFAAQRHLSVDQLYDWLNSEQILLARKRLSDMAQERADLLARLARPAAIEALLNLLTKGGMSDNQRRLAAGAILRAASAADRREDRREDRAAKASNQEEPAVPPAAGSSGGRSSSPESNPTPLHSRPALAPTPRRAPLRRPAALPHHPDTPRDPSDPPRAIPFPAARSSPAPRNRAGISVTRDTPPSAATITPFELSKGTEARPEQEEP